MGVEALGESLSRCRVLMLDTMVFSYHLAGHPGYTPLTSTILRAVESGAVAGLTTTITLVELLTRPAQEDDLRAMWDYEAYLTNFPNLRLVSLDAALARETALIRAATKLRMPDAVQIAAARIHGADAIVTNDHSWIGKVTTPALIVLDDYLEAPSDTDQNHP